MYNMQLYPGIKKHVHAGAMGRGSTSKKSKLHETSWELNDNQNNCNEIKNTNSSKQFVDAIGNCTHGKRRHTTTGKIDTTNKRLKSTSESPDRKYIGEINTSSNRCENSCGKTITLSKYAQSVFNTKNIYKKL